MRDGALDYQRELDAHSVESSIIKEFHSFYYLRINQRRQEHLESLRLPIRNKTVWEVSAGIGDHTSYFIDRDSTVSCSEVRPELLTLLKYRYPKVDVFPLDLEHPAQPLPQRFQVIYAYGVLYHLQDPARALHFMAKHCTEMLLLETCVSYGSQLQINTVEERAEFASQAKSGIGCRPTRAWVFEELKKLFSFVYIPFTQPNHEQFPVDWTEESKCEAPFARAIFIASRLPIRNELLVEKLLERQLRG
jgi:hypothetical protein